MSDAIATTPEPEPFEQLRRTLARYPANQYRLLLPTTMADLSSLYRPSPTVVYVDPDDGRDVYPTPGGARDSFCLHNQTLERIANAAGIDFDSRMSRHVHDVVREPFICEQHVGGYYTDAQGARRRITASAKSDLRDGTPTAKLLAGGLNVARQFICERTESRARNRTIRKTTNLPSSFTRAELTLPMVAVRFRLDERHPDVRKALIAAGAAAADEVFPAQDGDPIDAGQARPDEFIEGQIIDTTTGQTPAEPDIPDDAPAAPPPPPPDPVVAIVARAVADVRKRPAGERDTPATDDDIRAVGIAVRDVLGLRGRVTQPRWRDVRLAIVRRLFGVASTRDLTTAHARVLVDMSKDPNGQGAIGTVFNAAMTNDAALGDVAKEWAASATPRK